MGHGPCRARRLPAPPPRRAALRPEDVGIAARPRWRTRGLRLDEVERDHLLALAGHNAPATALCGEEPDPGLVRVLEQIDGSPAMIVSDLAPVP